MDVINLISKVQSFPDAPITVPNHTYQPGAAYYANGPRLHEFLQDINRQVLSKYDTLTVGEMPFVRDDDEILRVVGAQSEELNMIFAFDMVDIDNVPGDFKFTLHDWDARDLKRITQRLQRLMLERDGWNSIFVENHDQPRSVSRYTDDSTHRERELGAKLLCLMQTSLAGTIYVYQGEELGMRNVPVGWDIDEYKDIESQNFYEKYTKELYPGDEEKEKLARKTLQKKARDNARTPMPWRNEESTHGGFTVEGGKTPWMRAHPDFAVLSAEQQIENPEPAPGQLSVRQFWKRGIANRKKHKEVFVYGDFEIVESGDEEVEKKVVSWRRWSSDEAFIFVGNFSGEGVQWKGLQGREWSVKKWVAGNYDERELEGRDIEKEVKEGVRLRAWEGLLGVVE
jgi:glycosidase